ncbi:MAG: hypothetical protein Tsb002_16250 [Wenzhouxiangellaceae bacterium]
MASDPLTRYQRWSNNGKVADEIRDTVYFTYRSARWLLITVGGVTVLFIGVLMIVLPGPAIVMIPAGLTILGLEYAWARRWLEQGKIRLARYLRQRRRQRY